MPELNEILKYAAMGMGIVTIILVIITMGITSEIGETINFLILITLYFLIVVPKIN